MKKHYNIFELERKLDTKIIKQTVTMRLDCDSVKYFKLLSKESDIPYQTLINMIGS